MVKLHGDAIPPSYRSVFVLSMLWRVPANRYTPRSNRRAKAKRSDRNKSWTDPSVQILSELNQSLWADTKTPPNTLVLKACDTQGH